MNTKRLLEVTAKQRRVPGIIFVDGVAGRRARVAGSGLEVCEVIMSYYEVDKDKAQLRDLYDWLTDSQIDAALAYYEAYPEEIDAWLQESERLQRVHSGRTA